MDEFERKLKGRVWIWKGGSAWYFVTLPKKEAMEIKKKFSWVKRDWGSLPVTVILGKSRWNTSIFPDKKSDSYILPIKKPIRAEEKVNAGSMISFTLIIENIK